MNLILQLLLIRSFGLRYVHLYHKISPSPFESQRRRIWLGQSFGHAPIQTIAYVHIQLWSHLWMNFTTSFIMTENSRMMWQSSSEIGISLSLVSWPASTWVLSARLFIVHVILLDPWNTANSISIIICAKNERSQLRKRPGSGRLRKANTVCATGSSCFKSDNIQDCWSITNHLADCIPEFNNYPRQHCSPNQSDSEQTATHSILPPFPWFVDPEYSNQSCEPTIIFKQRITIAT